MKKNIFNCLFLTLLSGLSSIATYGQVSNPTNIWSNTSDYVGWSTSHDVLFKINGTQYLTLKTSGDLNVVAGAKGYQINGNYVLRHDGNPNNIFVGVDAGNSGMTSSYNTFMGKTAGNLNAAADNTFVGSYCGAFNYSGEQNTFTGSESGQFNSSGHDNSFLGFHSGGANQYGHYNTFIGSVAGAGNGGVGVFDADNNTAVGYYAGANNIEGYENLFLGANANAYYTSGINNSCAIGCNTMVRTPNTVILGNNLMNVGIGLSDIAGGPLANLHVFRDHFVNVTDPTAVFVENNDVDKDGDYYGNAYGIRVRTLGANLFNYGGHFKAENATINTAGRFEATSIAAINSGGYFIAANAEESNIGLSSHALDGQLSEGGIFSGSNAVTNFGVDATADAALNNDYNFGVKGLANPGRNTIFNVGVLGEAPVNIPDPSAGIGTWAVYADGDMGYTGTLFSLSDSKIKTAIQPLDEASVILGKLNGYSFYFDTTLLGNAANVSHSKQFGVLAQELEVVAPNLVLNTNLPPVLDSLGKVITPATPVKMVNYIGLIPLLVQGYNKQQAQLDSLIAVVAQLGTAGQRSTGSNGNQNTQQLTTELTDGNAIILDQNSPNPFAEQTKITWFIPEDNAAIGSLNAQLYFYNRAGTILKTVPIEQTGYGELTVYANNLSDGTYTYTLVVNDKVIDTKNMVKTK